MTTRVTKGIQITVRTEYQPAHSQPQNGYYLFSYYITIENKSDMEVKLLRRHWNIFDSNGEYRQVDGEGVIGEQPTLQPGEAYEYESACNLNTDMGKMDGTYLMERVVDKLQFYVTIPAFEMVVPLRLN